jgi:hypothetical protein
VVVAAVISNYSCSAREHTSNDASELAGFRPVDLIAHSLQIFFRKSIKLDKEICRCTLQTYYTRFQYLPYDHFCATRLSEFLT